MPSLDVHNRFSLVPLRTMTGVSASDSVVLPTFLVIGAAKSGTTSLYHLLRQHPDVFMPAVKEPRFFAYVDDPPEMVGPGDEESNTKAGAVYSWDDYCALFAGADGAAAIGEASVNYLYSETAPHRIAERVPDAHLVAVLRNPIERAYSHYLHLLRSGREPHRDFRKALEAEESRRREGWEWSWHYTEMGFYHKQLRRYLEYFDRDQITIYLFDDFKEDNIAVTQDIYRTIGVEDTFVPDASLMHAKTGVPVSDWFQNFLLTPEHPVRRATRLVLPQSVRDWLFKALQNANLSKPEMDPDVRKDLIELYEEEVARLEDLLDRDLSHWLA